MQKEEDKEPSFVLSLRNIPDPLNINFSSRKYMDGTKNDDTQNQLMDLAAKVKSRSTERPSSSNGSRMFMLIQRLTKQSIKQSSPTEDTFNIRKAKFLESKQVIQKWTRPKKLLLPERKIFYSPGGEKDLSSLKIVNAKETESGRPGNISGRSLRGRDSSTGRDSGIGTSSLANTPNQIKKEGSILHSEKEFLAGGLKKKKPLSSFHNNENRLEKVDEPLKNIDLKNILANVQLSGGDLKKSSNQEGKLQENDSSVGNIIVKKREKVRFIIRRNSPSAVRKELTEATQNEICGDSKIRRPNKSTIRAIRILPDLVFNHEKMLDKQDFTCKFASSFSRNFQNLELIQKLDRQRPPICHNYLLIIHFDDLVGSIGPSRMFGPKDNFNEWLDPTFPKDKIERSWKINPEFERKLFYLKEHATLVLIFNRSKEIELIIEILRKRLHFTFDAVYSLSEQRKDVSNVDIINYSRIFGDFGFRYLKNILIFQPLMCRDFQGPCRIVDLETRRKSFIRHEVRFSDNPCKLPYLPIDDEAVQVVSIPIDKCEFANKSIPDILWKCTHGIFSESVNNTQPENYLVYKMEFSSCISKIKEVVKRNLKLNFYFEELKKRKRHARKVNKETMLRGANECEGEIAFQKPEDLRAKMFNDFKAENMGKRISVTNPYCNNFYGSLGELVCRNYNIFYESFSVKTYTDQKDMRTVISEIEKLSQYITNDNEEELWPEENALENIILSPNSFFVYIPKAMNKDA